MESYGSGAALVSTRCDPDYHEGVSVPPLVHLGDIRVYDQPVSPARLNELRPEENQLTFDFLGTFVSERESGSVSVYSGEL